MEGSAGLFSGTAGDVVAAAEELWVVSSLCDAHCNDLLSWVGVALRNLFFFTFCADLEFCRVNRIKSSAILVSLFSFNHNGVLLLGCGRLLEH